MTKHNAENTQKTYDKICAKISSKVNKLIALCEEITHLSMQRNEMGAELGNTPKSILKKQRSMVYKAKKMGRPPKKAPIKQKRAYKKKRA